MKKSLLAIALTLSTAVSAQSGMTQPSAGRGLVPSPAAVQQFYPSDMLFAVTEPSPDPYFSHKNVFGVRRDGTLVLSGNAFLSAAPGHMHPSAGLSHYLKVEIAGANPNVPGYTVLIPVHLPTAAVTGGQ